MKNRKLILEKVDKILQESNRSRVNGIDQFSKRNSDRIGKKALNIEGKEIPNSLVLSDSCWVYKVGVNYKIISYDYISNEMFEIILDKNEISLLSKFKA